MKQGKVMKLDQVFVTRESSRRKPPESLYSHFLGNIKDLIGQQIAIAKMMMR